MDSKTSLEIGKLLGVHQIISGEVTFLTASNPEHLKNTQRYTKEVVIDTETYTEDWGGQEATITESSDMTLNCTRQ